MEALCGWVVRSVFAVAGVVLLSLFVLKTYDYMNMLTKIPLLLWDSHISPHHPRNTSGKNESFVGNWHKPFSSRGGGNKAAACGGGVVSACYVHAFTCTHVKCVRRCGFVCICVQESEGAFVGRLYLDTWDGQTWNQSGKDSQKRLEGGWPGVCDESWVCSPECTGAEQFHERRHMETWLIASDLDPTGTVHRLSHHGWWIYNTCIASIISRKIEDIISSSELSNMSSLLRSSVDLHLPAFEVFS